MAPSGKMPLVLSHFSVGTPYAELVERLRASCENFKLRYELRGFKSTGTWRGNSNKVAEMVLLCLADHPDDDVLYVDADAVIQRRPTLFERPLPGDVGAHIHNFNWHKNELLGGTLFFRNIPSVRTLVETWNEWCLVTRKLERPGDLLQELLNIEPAKSTVRFFELPATYCKIFDKMPEVDDAVIEHFQASRKNRQVINKMGKAR